jgi:hypothetical protein
MTGTSTPAARRRFTISRWGPGDDAREHVLRQVAGPGVEQLQHLGAGPGLHHQVIGGRLHQHGQQSVDAGRILMHPAARLFTVPAAAALDHVGQHRPGRARKADQRPLRLEGRAHPAQRLADGRERLPGRRRPGLHFRQFGKRAKLRSFAGLEPHVLAQSPGDQQDVGEDDGSVVRKAAHRLERGFRRHLGVQAEGDEVRRLSSQRPVLGQVTPCLTHEPHRGALERLAAKGSQQGRPALHVGP